MSLGADCISRAQAQTEIEMNASRYTIARERSGMGQVEWSDQLIKVSDAVNIIRELPPATPQDIDYKAQYERLSQKAEIVISQLRADRDRLMSLTSVTPQESKSEWQKDHEILKAYSDGANEVLDKIRAEIAEYGSIMVSYAITKDTKTDKGIEKLVSDVLKEAKQQVLEIIDKYKGESEG